MTDSAEPSPPPPDPALQLDRDVYLTLVTELRAMLPLPFDDTPEGLARRDRVAIAEVAALLPANPAEAKLAARHVAAGAHANECLAQQVKFAADIKQSDQLRAQAARMGRECRGYLSALLRAQALRMRREGDRSSCQKADIAEYCIQGLLRDALRDAPPAQVRPPEPPAPPPSAKVPVLAAPPVPRDYKDWTDEEKRRDRLAWEADRYAIFHPERVRDMRRAGRVPDDAKYVPPRPELLELILHGDMPNLIWAETYVRVPYPPPPKPPEAKPDLSIPL